MNQLKAGAVLSYLYLGLGTAISIAYTPFMLRLLGQSEYGLYNLVASVVSYLGLLNFGFGHAYIRYFSRFNVKDDRENIAKLNGMFLIIFTIIGLIAVLAGVALVYYTETILGSELSERELSIARVLMAIMVINIAISFPAIVFNSHITAKEKFIFQKSLQLVRVIANPLLVLPVLIMGYGSIGMVVVITVLNLAIEIFNMLFCFKKLHIQFSFRGFDFSLMKEMAVFSSFIFINLIVNQINWNVDRFILGRFHGTIAVATYSLSSQLNAYYLSLSTAISNMFVPRVNKMVSSEKDSRSLTSLFTSVGRMQFFVLSMVFTGLIFFGKPFISMWAGADYAESYPIALILIVPVTIPLNHNLGIEIQRAKNMHKFRSWVYLFIAIGNIFITIPLVKLYGGIGAAAGTAIALIIGNIFIMNWYYHRRVGLNILFFWKRIISILPSTIPPVLLGLFLSSYFDLFEIHILVICGFSYIVVYTISIWLFGLNDYEKSLVIRPLNRIKSKLF